MASKDTLCCACTCVEPHKLLESENYFARIRWHGSSPQNNQGRIRPHFIDRKIAKIVAGGYANLDQARKKLAEAKVPYEFFNYPLAYTSQEIAARQHVPGNEIAKVVVVDVDGTLVMG